ncbi:MAG: DNA ligase-associated DEXH box helicase, partial [Pseudomonadota bacterium]
MADPLLEVRAAGLWCPPAKAWIDPTRAVGRAIVTHGHGDHCRPGSRALLATPETAAIARTRYGKEAFAKVETLAYGEVRELGAARVWLAPAGHVLGSAQVVIEAGGVRAVVSGDYKREVDPTCAPFELVECDL